jgi:uncharacterized membrane protein (UPF0127 family)
MARNLWLDAPPSAPAWVPRVGDARSVRRLELAIVVLLVLGVAAFVVRGADRPADPVLGASTGGPPGSAAPGEPPGIASRVPLEGFGEIAIEITDPDGEVVGWCVLLAESTEQRRQGLQGVTDLQGYPGMLFRHAEDTNVRYTMRNTPMPLSIAWFDASGALVSQTDMEPCENVDGCPPYASAAPYRTSLEVPRGDLAALGVAAGSRLDIGGACAPRGG